MLDEYGSKEPGIKNTEALLIKQNKTAVLEVIESKKSLSSSNRSNDRDRDSSVSKYEGSSAVPVPCSDFAQLIKRDASAELDRLSSAHFAYAGTYVHPSARVCVCVCVCGRV